MASASGAIEVPVFIDSSLGTHTAISVSPDLTAAEFKRKFESIHSDCYPEIGNIKVNGLMAKRKGYLYHLSESMPIKYAFQGSKRTCFLYIEAYPLNKKTTSTPQTEAVHGDDGGLSEKRTKNNCTSTKSSESITVSDIIKKYFSVYDEVTSTESRPRVPKYAPKTPPAVTSVKASRDLKNCRGVGNGVILAANNLGISSSDKKPVISLCKYKGDNKSFSHVRHPVFEIGEE